MPADLASDDSRVEAGLGARKGITKGVKAS